MWDEDVNGAIDEVARQMTEDAPPASADFRRRVLARIASNEAPRASWRAAFVLSPLAVAAAIVMAVFIVRRPGPIEPDVSRPAPTVGTVPTDAAGLGEARGASNRAEAEGPALQPAVRRPGPLGLGVSRPAPQLDPIDTASIAVAPLVVGALTPDSIQIERLDAVAPIDVAPLEIITDLQRRQE